MSFPNASQVQFAVLSAKFFATPFYNSSRSFARSNWVTDNLTFPKYPHSARYDLHWMMENSIGPNAVWLTGNLTQVMDLKPGMRFLAMGCGKRAPSWIINILLSCSLPRDKIQTVSLRL